MKKASSTLKMLIRFHAARAEDDAARRICKDLMNKSRMLPADDFVQQIDDMKMLERPRG